MSKAGAALHWRELFVSLSLTLSRGRSWLRGSARAPREVGGGGRAPSHAGPESPLCTGILWNLSSSDNLKDRLARDTLEQLTDTVLVPLSGLGGSGVIQQNPSEAEIFYNSTGFLRYVLRASTSLPTVGEVSGEEETRPVLQTWGVRSRLISGVPIPCSTCAPRQSLVDPTGQGFPVAVPRGRGWPRGSPFSQ